jgi:hypothetical protein
MNYMSFTNSNVTKIQKKARFNHEEASERLTKGRKLNKTQRNSKRDLWNDEE